MEADIGWGSSNHQAPNRTGLRPTPHQLMPLQSTVHVLEETTVFEIQEQRERRRERHVHFGFEYVVDVVVS